MAIDLKSKLYNQLVKALGNHALADQLIAEIALANGGTGSVGATGPAGPAGATGATGV